MMDTYVDERDYELLEADKYTFFVLKRIMGGEYKLLLSDHERLILCFTGYPFPVWIWTADDASELKINTNMYAYDCLDPVRPETEADGGIYRCEMKDIEELVDFWIASTRNFALIRRIFTATGKMQKLLSIPEICISGKMIRGIAQQAVNMFPPKILHR